MARHYDYEYLLTFPDLAEDVLDPGESEESGVISTEGSENWSAVALWSDPESGFRCGLVVGCGHVVHLYPGD